MKKLITTKKLGQGQARSQSALATGMFTKNSFSYSSLNLFNECSWCWYLKYIKGIKQKWKSHHLLMGIIIHRFIEDSKIDIDKVIKEEFNKIKYLDGPPKNEIIKEIKNLIKVIQDNPVDIEIKQSEVFFEIKMNDFLLNGRIDEISKDEKIVEHKTSNTKYTENYIRKSNQHIIYEIAYRNLYKKKSNGVIYDIIYKDKLKRELIEIQIRDDEIERTKIWIEGLVNRIKNQQWQPVNKINFLHRKFCDYFLLCHFCSH